MKKLRKAVYKDRFKLTVNGTDGIIEEFLEGNKEIKVEDNKEKGVEGNKDQKSTTDSNQTGTEGKKVILSIGSRKYR